MTDLTIYGDARSTYVRTVRMACHEKGVSYDLEPADLGSDDYRALHPFARMPAARHGDLTIYETSAIVVYVDSAFNGLSLRPTDAADLAGMVRWVSAINDYFYGSMIRRYVLQYVFPSGPDGQPNREVIDAALPEIRHQLGVTDEGLGGGNFLVGDKLSHADLFLAPVLFYMVMFPESGKMLGEFPNIQKSAAAIQARPSFTETMPPLPG